VWHGLAVLVRAVFIITQIGKNLKEKLKEAVIWWGKLNAFVRDGETGTALPIDPEPLNKPLTKGYKKAAENLLVAARQLGYEIVSQHGPRAPRTDLSNLTCPGCQETLGRDDWAAHAETCDDYIALVNTHDLFPAANSSTQ
jgi:hypothetical protein